MCVCVYAYMCAIMRMSLFVYIYIYIYIYTRGLSEKYRGLICWLKDGEKYKWILLSSNIMSWKYIIEIFLQPWYFLICSFLTTPFFLFFRSFSYEPRNVTEIVALKVFKQKQAWFVKSPLVMRHVFLNTTLIQRGQ